MIELRVVERTIHIAEIGRAHQVRVLQVRKEEGPRGESWWGDWKDVPIVTEEIWA